MTGDEPVLVLTVLHSANLQRVFVPSKYLHSPGVSSDLGPTEARFPRELPSEEVSALTEPLDPGKSLSQEEPQHGVLSSQLAEWRWAGAGRQRVREPGLSRALWQTQDVRGQPQV